MSLRFHQSRLNGKVCMITGSNSGIGKATALGLARIGATVVMVCRDKSRGEEALAEIETKSGNDSIDLMLADLSSQESIRQFVAEFTDRYKRLHVLVNNAGVFRSKRSETVDGIATTFAVNHLSYFLLTNLLLDVLKVSAPARIVNVSSAAHRRATINFDDLQYEKHYNGYRVYSQSKLANILFTHELARRLRATGVTANCLHPGFVKTNLLRRENASWYFRLAAMVLRPIMLTAEKGAETCIYLASSPQLEGVSGKYFIKKDEVKPSVESYNESISQRLWRISAEVTKLNT